MTWILVWLTYTAYPCYDGEKYYIDRWAIFSSSETLYSKYNSLDANEKKSARIVGGSEYEIKPLYEILRKK